MTDHDDPLRLSATEARILGSLIEKEATTPEQYPLTQNAVQLACNQKTSREPVMNLQPGEVGHALRQMEQRRLVRSIHAARAQRYEHLATQAYGLTRQQQAVIALLLLRGAQTAGELLARSERLANFADAEDMTHCLARLIQREPALIAKLPRLPGQREDRYAHLLSGDIDLEALAASVRSEPTRGDTAQRLADLEARVEALEQALQALQSQSKAV
ncbi:MAG: YceH family protein [Lysobacteraceae bacterium]